MASASISHTLPALFRPCLSRHRAFVSKFEPHRSLKKRAFHRTFISRQQPKKDEPPMLITTPIFYANAEPHIGHLYSTVLADVLKRFYELKGREVVFSTGTDEHGQKIQEAAQRKGIDTLKFCDEVSQKFKTLFEAANISYTDYIRTTEPRQKRAVQALWTDLRDRGYIYKGTHEGWYSVSDETFYPATQVEEVRAADGTTKMVSKETGQPVTWTTEENYKFRLSAFQSQLQSWLTQNPTAIHPPQKHHLILSTLTTHSHEQLADLSVSRLRSRMQWGIPVPGDEEHVVYVWLDALANYLTVLGYPWTEGETGMRARMQRAWPAAWHVVGQDILKFHAIYWPAFLLAVNLPPPIRILAHAHWLRHHVKMSKSRGNVVDPMAAIATYGVDSVRWFLMRDSALVYDSDFSDEMIHQRYTKDLERQFGNLVMRCCAPKVNKRMLAPSSPGTLTDADRELHDSLAALPGIVETCYENAEFAAALEHITHTISLANRHWDATKPWLLARTSPSSSAAADILAQDRLRTILYYAIETVRVCGILLQPVMPGKMGVLLDGLAVGEGERGWGNARVGGRWVGGDGREEVVVREGWEGTVVPVQRPLFPRLM
ncbi:tRNA synthetases class I (M)-domain-containing protein [Fimicolochytrium jonesii]|uniref:tRNA synthetases class I (M)-domain-containing protein n=1 Tax=Fimicolochytrium jonesii TaxID=1396493 RepID=UPI0022FDEAA7|nr:tRNA synthetases class I (M)-domain-containing protein [Fimicolochytrium jonesii]KAI8818075.1 tRNA synthetases class I (M)-domain-containing protein [Fimicolochytrium jonesii]